jgi:hypothetical protein
MLCGQLGALKTEAFDAADACSLASFGWLVEHQKQATLQSIANFLWVADYTH